jgi:hypothetical protein
MGFSKVNFCDYGVNVVLCFLPVIVVLKFHITSEFLFNEIIEFGFLGISIRAVEKGMVFCSFYLWSMLVQYPAIEDF